MATLSEAEDAMVNELGFLPEKGENLLGNSTQGKKTKLTKQTTGIVSNRVVIRQMKQTHRGCSVRG